MQTSIKKGWIFSFFKRLFEFFLFSKDYPNDIHTYTKAVDIVWRSAFTGHSNSEYPSLFTSEQPVAFVPQNIVIAAGINELKSFVCANKKKIHTFIFDLLGSWADRNQWRGSFKAHGVYQEDSSRWFKARNTSKFPKRIIIQEAKMSCQNRGRRFGLFEGSLQTVGLPLKPMRWSSSPVNPMTSLECKNERRWKAEISQLSLCYGLFIEKTILIVLENQGFH